MSWLGYADAADLARAEEAARNEARRAKEEQDRADRERRNAEEARKQASDSESRAKVAEEQAQKESHRAKEEKELADKERKAAAKAKEEAATNARRAEQAEEQAQKENQRAKEVQTIADKERERAEEARVHAEKEARISEEMRQKKESAEQEKQRLLDEKNEKQRRDENLMQFAWGPKKTERGRWTSQEVEHLRNQFLEHMYDKEGKLIRGKILIFGPSGAGKSSFCNGLRSALKDSAAPANYYAVGNLHESLTSNFQPTQYGDHWIIDMPGIFESSDFKTENIKAIASGKVRFDAQITKRLDVTGNLQEARRDVSCVVLVLHHGITLGDELKRQIEAVIRLGGDGALSYHLVLTHLDECDPQFKDPDNLPNLYNSPRVQEAVKMMSEQTGIPPYAISYVKNYVTETKTHTNAKLLHLEALDRILTSAADQVEKMIDLKLKKNMYEDAPDTEETQAVSEEKKLTSTDWTIPMSIFAVVMLFVAVVYMFIQ
ncbi:uncharacterized protein LOC124118985 isoform X2 [Haliotis rufescens]|uniref:uncharacterized protein LOC124118985 isoform X2 n=1 Tax=Haliotis rufescens TaxID=6454 RepID=UPI00201EFD3B|nr:uncharacterized protein LOC124118985 isoform X2 [Haliotis rufescens]